MSGHGPDMAPRDSTLPVPPPHGTAMTMPPSTSNLDVSVAMGTAAMFEAPPPPPSDEQGVQKVVVVIVIVVVVIVIVIVVIVMVIVIIIE